MDWTIIRVELENDGHCYYSLYTPQPLNPDFDIELENENDEPIIIQSGVYEIIIENLSESEMDEFIEMSLEDQDEYIENLPVG